jgi:Holliday junction resolvase
MTGNISRSRGYSFESQLVRQLKNSGWKAKRLGGTSTEFPDIVATKQAMLLALEAKAYSSDNIYIPVDQFHRCFDVCDMFNFYEHRSAIFAFKFNRIVGKRSVKYFFGFMDSN